LTEPQGHNKTKNLDKPGTAGGRISQTIKPRFRNFIEIEKWKNEGRRTGHGGQVVCHQGRQNTSSHQTYDAPIADLKKRSGKKATAKKAGDTLMADFANS
jgi:hypothetical protein